MTGGYIFHFKNQKFRALKNDRGGKIFISKIEKIRPSKMTGGYIFHFKNCFFSKVFQ